MWGNQGKSNINKQQLAQNFATRIVLGLKKFDHVSDGRRSLKWLNVSENILFVDLVSVVFKCLDRLPPSNLVDYFITHSATHSRNYKGLET